MTVTDVTPLAAPYRGLSPFGDTELDALLFFGRERETEIAVANLIAARLTILYGPSGVGKSSLLGAGVARRVRELGGRRAIGRGPDGAAVVFSAWADDPVHDLGEAIAQEVTSLVKRPVARPEPGTPLVDVVEHWTNVLDGSLYLVLDQLEEYFVYHEGLGGPGTLEHELPEVVLRSRLRANVLLSLRDDALAQLDVFKSRLPNLFGNYLRLDRLDRTAARAAILGPVERWNALVPADQRAEVEPALVTAVLAEAAVAGEPDRIEPTYLQLVLERLWNEERDRGSNVLHASTLAELGGASAIVREHLDRALSVLDEREQDAAAQMFDHLVTPSGTKVAHRTADLAQFARVPEADAAVMLAALGRERIVRPLDEGGDSDRYEIYHDVLGEAILGWRRRHQLVLEREKSRRRQRRLAALAVASLAAVAVMVGITLYALSQRSHAQHQTNLAVAATEVAHQKTIQLEHSNNDLHQANRHVTSLLATTRLAERVAQQQRRRLAVEAVALHHALDEATASKNAAEVAQQQSQQSADEATAANQATQVALQQSNDHLKAQQAATKQAKSETQRADEETQQANTARTRADAQARLARMRKDLAAAQAQLNVDPAQSVRDALTASAELPAEATPVLRDSLAALDERHVVGGAPKSMIGSVALSPDGKRFVAAEGVGGAAIFDAVSGKPIRQLTSSGDVVEVAYSPDGATVATSDRAGTTTLWDVSGGTVHAERRASSSPRTLPGTQPITALTFSPDGHQVATGSVDQTIKLWDVATGELQQHYVLPRAVLSLSYSPDGTELLATDGDRFARLYTLGSSTPVILDNTQRVTVARFSPDGSKIVTGTAGLHANGGAATNVWDGHTGVKLQTFADHESAVLDVAFSPNGQLLATASADDTSRVYDLQRSRPLSTFTEHTGSVDSIAFSPDGAYVVTGSTDHTARIWEATDGVQRRELLGSNGPVTHVAYAGADTVVTVSADGTARLWNPHDQPLRKLVGTHQKAVVAVAFALGGTRIVSASGDGTAVLWPLGAGSPVVLHHGDAVNGVAVSADGRKVLTWSRDGTAALWSASDGSRLVSFPQGTPVSAAALSSDGSLVATAGADGTAKLWSTDGGALLDTLAHPGVDAVAFSPDGSLLATGGSDRLARIWNTSDGEQVGTAGHPLTVSKLAFSPDGHFLASAAGDIAYVWSVPAWKQIFSVTHTNTVTSIAWSRDGGRLLTASLDSTAQLLNVRSGHILERYHGHVSTISQAALSADGRWVATAGPTTAGMWPTTFDPLLPDDRLFFLRGSGAQVLSVAFSPTGWRLATGDKDGGVRVYDCELCGGVAQLVPLAKRRLAALGPAG